MGLFVIWCRWTRNRNYWEGSVFVLEPTHDTGHYGYPITTVFTTQHGRRNLQGRFETVWRPKFSHPHVGGRERRDKFYKRTHTNTHHRAKNEQPFFPDRIGSHLDCQRAYYPQTATSTRPPTVLKRSRRSFTPLFEFRMDRRGVSKVIHYHYCKLFSYDYYF